MHKWKAAWRDQGVVEFGAAGKGAGLSFFNRFKKQKWLVHQECLGCIVNRKYADTMLDAMLAAGARGANVSHARLIEVKSKTTASGMRLNHESGIIRCVIDREIVETVKVAIKSTCAELGISDAFIFLQPITRAFTYATPITAEPQSSNAES